MAEEVKDLLDEMLEERFEELVRKFKSDMEEQERERERETARVRAETEARVRAETERHCSTNRDDIIRLGRKRIGEPSEEQSAALEAITDLDRLNRIFDRLLDAADWQDLIHTP